MRRALVAVAALLALVAAGAVPARAAVPAGSAGSAAPPPPERLLLIALDAVPLAIVAEATDPGRGDRALFQGFSGPAAMVSSFPSSTNVGMAGLLAPFGATPSPGYEPRFFDRAENRLRGAGPISYHRIVFPWRQVLDWQKPSLVSGMVGKLLPVRSSEKEIAAALRDFARSQDPVYLVYIAGTDGLGHLRSPAALTAVLESLDAELRALKADGVRFHTVLFSDHGMGGGAEPLVNVRGEVRRRLRAAGFNFRNRLRDPADLVLADLGMVSNFELYTQPGFEGRAAAVAAATSGVELCAYRNPAGGWEVIGGPGGDGAEAAAWFGRREGPEGGLWAYRPRRGDPLGYRPVAARVAAAGAAGRGGGDWFPAAAWFEATVDARFPDALHRLAKSFELVANPASVTCSVAAGHMYGAQRTALAARLSIGHLRWTHGALDRDETLGFLMSDLPGWQAPAAVPFDRALVPFAGAAEDIAARAGAPAAQPAPVVARRER